MNEIGGYFELELNCGLEYHFNSIRLNLGRTSFEYVLGAKNVQKIYLPWYICDVMIEPVKRKGIAYRFYNLNENLEPLFDFDTLMGSDFFLYVNYFGLKDPYIKTLVNRVKNLIIDNSQAFFSNPLPGVDTFYSPRKFFGVPDGGYLYTNKVLEKAFETDRSSDRFGHLIGRIEDGAEKSYSKFKENDKKFCDQPIKKMSKITQKLLQNIDYTFIAEKRKRNYQYLHNKLAKKNLINFKIQSESVPLIYPFLTDINNLRSFLIGKKVFVAQYWPNVLEWCDSTQIEFKLASDLINLPIDQRLEKEDLDFIINCILKA